MYTLYINRVRMFFAIYDLKSTIKYIKTYTVWFDFPEFPEMIDSGKFGVFPKSREFPENPRKIPRKPRGKIRGFFMFYGCNRL
jgi:hypothetical protein